MGNHLLISALNWASLVCYYSLADEVKCLYLLLAAEMCASLYLWHALQSHGKNCFKYVKCLCTYKRRGRIWAVQCCSPTLEYINNSKVLNLDCLGKKSPSALPETAAASACKLAAPGWRQRDVHGDCELIQGAFAFPVYSFSFCSCKMENCFPSSPLYRDQLQSAFPKFPINIVHKVLFSLMCCTH